MKRFSWSSLSLMVGIVFFLGSTACVDESLQEPPANHGNDGTDNSSQEVEELEDCGPNEARNPLTGDCHPASSGPTLDHTQCDADKDEYWDPYEGECKVDDPSLDCTRQEVWDEDKRECIPRTAVDGCGFGNVEGQACRTDGLGLPSAEVRIVGVDCWGEPFETVAITDGQGIFDFTDVPAGQHDLLVTSGSFSHMSTVTVEDGVTTSLLGDNQKVCVEGDVTIAVFQGGSDDIRTILNDLELEFTDFTNLASDRPAVVNLLSDMSELSEYDILFFECGHSFHSIMSAAVDPDLILSNMVQFVQNGGSIYASDLAFAFVEEPFPHVANFGGNCASQEVPAEVVSPPMQTLLGNNSIMVNYDLGSWKMIDSVPASTVVHFRGSVTCQSNIPFMVSWTDPLNRGTVVYTSFHNRAQASEEIQDVLSFMIFQL